MRRQEPTSSVCLGIYLFIFMIYLTKGYALPANFLDPVIKAEKFIHLIISNENKKELNVIIKPEALNKTPLENSVPWLAFKVPECPPTAPNIEVEFKIPATELGNFDFFSVTGETNSLTPIGTCIQLKVGPCYKIVFTNNTLGTDCLSMPIRAEEATDARRCQIADFQKLIPEIPAHQQPGTRPSEVLPREGL